MRGTAIDDLDLGDLVAVTVGGDVFAGVFEGLLRYNTLRVMRLRMDSAPAPYRVLELIVSEIEAVHRHKRARPCECLDMGETLLREMAGLR